MDWIQHNSSDAKMLSLIDLSPLDATAANGEASLIKLLRRHNDALVELDGRFKKLASDRERAGKPDNWLDQDSSAVTTENRRLAGESWDSLVTLRKLLGERRDLLAKLEDHVANRLSHLSERQEQALDKARRVLSREHRQFIKSEPARGQSYIDGMAEEDDAVEQLRQQAMPLHHMLESLRSARHKIQDVAVTIRQREVFDLLN